MFLPGLWEALSYLIFALFRVVGAVLGSLLDLSPW